MKAIKRYRLNKTSPRPAITRFPIYAGITKEARYPVDNDDSKTSVNHISEDRIGLAKLGITKYRSGVKELNKKSRSGDTSRSQSP